MGSARRYVLYDEIASGGMAAVHLARMRGALGFARTVAIKRLHPHLARDPAFIAMFLDEARVAARIRHPNVVSIMDVVTEGDEILLVMDYVHGEALSRLVRAPVPLPIVSAITCDVLAGLHAAHEAVSEDGQPLRIIHRDVSPQNVLVGFDGIARVVDFGVAKAASRLHTTRDEAIKGKVSYMAPEQLQRRAVDRRADIYAASVVAWELIAGRRLFVADDPGGLIAAVLEPRSRPSLREMRGDISTAVEKVVERGMAFMPDARFGTALEMAKQLQRALAPAPRDVVAAWMGQAIPGKFEKSTARLAAVESLPLPGQTPGAVITSIEKAREERAARAKRVEAITEVQPMPVRPMPAAPTVKKNARTRILGAVTVVAIALAAGGWALARRGPRARVPDSPAYASTTKHERGPTVAVPPRAAIAGPADGPLSDSATPAAPVKAATALPKVSAPVRRDRGSRGGTDRESTQSPTRVRRRAANCDPPYFVDAAGIRRVRQGCY